MSKHNLRKILDLSIKVLFVINGFNLKAQTYAQIPTPASNIFLTNAKSYF